MDRLTVASAVPADRAEILSDRPALSAAAETAIDRRADALVTERLYDNPDWFADLMAGAGSTVIESDLQRALKNLDAAINGDEISRTAVFTALSNAQKSMKRMATEQWRADLRDEAEAEYERGEL